MTTRTPLRTDVHRELLGQLLQGTLTPGSRLKDTDVAKRLGVSRTPVREALLRLEREGFISSHMGQGFRVRALSLQEVQEVYPLISLLERQALQAHPPLDAHQKEKLEALAQEMSDPSLDPLRSIEVDLAWHSALLEGCVNGHLFRILDELKRICFRYECTYMQVPRWVARSVAEHRAIAAALGEGDTRKTQRLLDSHWRRSLQSVASSLQSQPPMAALRTRRSSPPTLQR